MAGARMPGAAHGPDCFQGSPAAGRHQSRPGHQRQRRRGAGFSIAGQTRRRRAHSQPARPGLSPRRSKIHVTSSISRQLIFWLAVPLLLMALCGALVHYFNSIAPGIISSDRRLKEASNSLMAHVVIKEGRAALDDGAGGKPPLPAADSVKYALRDAQGHLLAGDAQIPAVSMNSDTSQLFAMSQIDERSLRTLTTRFDTRAGVILITVADVHPPTDPAVRFSFMSTLLWDFVQLDVTLVLVWVGIQLGLRPVKRLRDEIAQRSPLDLRPIVESSVPREISPVVVTLNRLFTMLR